MNIKIASVEVDTISGKAISIIGLMPPGPLSLWYNLFKGISHSPGKYTVVRAEYFDGYLLLPYRGFKKSS